MKNNLFQFLVIYFLITNLQAQSTWEVASDKFWGKGILSEKKGKIGIYSKYNKKWEIEPEYDKVTGVKFSEVPGGVFIFKFWKDTTFDLYVDDYYFRNGNHMNLATKLLVKNVTEIKFTNGQNNGLFFTYKANDRWGYFFRWEKKSETINGGYKLISSTYNSEPILGKHLGTSASYLDVEIDGKLAVFNRGPNEDNSERIALGDYRAVIEKQGYILITGQNQLKGYSLETGQLIKPQYLSVEKLFNKNGTIPYFICTQPDSAVVVMKYGHILMSDLEIAAASEDVLQLKDIAKSYIFKETILGDLLVEKTIHKSGTIISVGNLILNQKFINLNNYDDQQIYTFETKDKTLIYFKINDKAVKCNYCLPKSQKLMAIKMSKIPWDGTENPVPEILMDSTNTLVIVNAMNGKRKILPCPLSNGELIYDGKTYTLNSFINHKNINFIRKNIIKCDACSSKGHIVSYKKVLVPGEIKITTKKETSYKETYNYTSERHESTPTTVTKKIETKMPDTYKEEMVKTQCKYCLGKGGNYTFENIRWDGNKFTLLKN